MPICAQYKPSRAHDHSPAARARSSHLLARTLLFLSVVRACIAHKEHVTRAREFEMSSRAPVSSRAILFSSRGGDLPRAQASVVRSV